MPDEHRACIPCISETISEAGEEKTVSLDVAGKFRYPSPDLAWLSQRVEEVLEPALPIVDAHHHLWEEGGSPYLLAEMRADVDDGHRGVQISDPAPRPCVVRET